MDVLFASDIHQEISQYFTPYSLIPLLLVCKKWKLIYTSASSSILRRLLISMGNNSSLSDFPNVTFKQVITLSLAHYPIPASLAYYDSYTLFYRACELNYHNPTVFLPKFDDKFNIQHDGVIAWICYKFNRLNILTYIHANLYSREGMWMYGHYSLYKSITDLLCLKLGLAVVYGNGYEYWEFIDSIWSHYSIFTSEEILEIIIFAHLLGIESHILPYLMSGRASKKIIDIGNIVNVHIRELGLGKVNEIMIKYKLPCLSASRVYDESAINQSGFGNIINMGKIRHNSSMAETIIPDIYLGSYYITSGRFVDYLKWVCKGGRLSKLTRSYFGMNKFGFASLNRDLVEASKVRPIKNLACVHCGWVALDKDWTYIKLVDFLVYGEE